MKILHRKLQKIILRIQLSYHVLMGYETDYGRNRFQISFSQNGEDLMLRGIFHHAGISKVRYVDIGAHHPVRMNNTYLFYLHGGHGMNIEPDPVLFQSFLKPRSRDLNWNLGIGAVNGDCPYYRMGNPLLNTFCEKEARRMEAEEGIPIIEKIKLPVRTINDVLGKVPFAFDLLTIDTEGLDYDILEAIDFERYQPLVVCAETLTFSTSGGGMKNREIAKLLASRGYKPYADTHINTIYKRMKPPETR